MAERYLSLVVEKMSLPVWWENLVVESHVMKGLAIDDSNRVSDVLVEVEYFGEGRFVQCHKRQWNNDSEDKHFGSSCTWQGLAYLLLTIDHLECMFLEEVQTYQ